MRDVRRRSRLVRPQGHPRHERREGVPHCYYAYKALRACGDEAYDIAAWVQAIAKKAAADALEDMRTEMRRRDDL